MASTDSKNERATRLIRLRSVLDRTALSETTIWRERRAGRFPEPIRISPGAVAWRESDIEEWIENRRRQTEIGPR